MQPWLNLMLYRRNPRMLIVDTPAGKFGITFRHHPFRKPTFDREVCKKFLNGRTDCDIYRFSGGSPDAAIYSSGVGLCKFPDAFSKALGRKRSLTSALGKKTLDNPPKSWFSKGTRQLIWDAYWQMLTPEVEPTDPVQESRQATHSEVCMAGLDIGGNGP